MLSFKKRSIKRLSTMAFGVVVLFAILGIYLNLASPLPKLYPNGKSTVVVAQNGQVLRSFSNQLGVHSYSTNLDNVSPFYISSLLNYEDKWFYYHIGVNPFSLVRAAYQWASAGKVVSGGSTITMQVARLIDPHSRTIAGKLKQIWRALQLEWYYSKDQILTMYLNLAPFGGNIEGVEAASRRYFNHSANSLNIAESSLLVVLPQKPSIYRPDRHPQIAQKMRNKVLMRSLNAGLINKRQEKFISQETVQLDNKPQSILVPLLSRRLKTQYPNLEIIKTTIDYELQSSVKRLLEQTVNHLPEKTSAAILIVRNQDRKIIAYQGSADFSDLARFSYVDMVQGIRSPGSTLKPFIYGMAIDDGIIHSESLLSDIPTSFFGYKPTNLNARYSGSVSMSLALKKSLNVPLIQVLNRLTPERFNQKLRKADINLQHTKTTLAIGLGGTGTKLWDLARLYTSLANQGQVGDLSALSNEENTKTKPLLSPESSWIIFKILSTLSAPDRVVPSVRRQIAWKTGTSYGYRDFWSVGVSADYTVGVWVGRPDNSPVVGYLGATQAAPILFDAFDLLPRDKQKITQPDKVQLTKICWPGGQAVNITPADRCDYTKKAWTMNGLTPPSMQSSGEFVINHNWPRALKLWLNHNRFSAPQTSTQAQPKQVPSDSSTVQTVGTTDTEILTPTILNLRTGQHYFSDQIDRLPLQASISSSSNSQTSNQQLEWYVNHQPYHQSELTLTRYHGKTTISACFKARCDKKVIYVH